MNELDAESCILFELGKHNYSEGDYAKALVNYRALLSTNAKNNEVLFELGKTYYKLGAYALSLDYLKQCLAELPENGYARLLMAKCYISYNRYDLVIKELKEACRLLDSGEAYFELGLAYEAQGDYCGAIEYLKKAREKGEDISRASFQLARAYRETGEYELSVKTFETMRSLSIYKDSEFYKNKIDNEIEISQKKIILVSKPMVLGVTLTHNCNIRCRMCSYWNDPWSIPDRRIEEIRGLFPYLRHVYWQGGEPFFSPYFKELFENASLFPNLLQTVVTNGLFIDEQWAQKLVRSNVAIIWSIDSTNKQTYEHIRVGAKFEHMQENILRLNKYREVASRNQTLSPEFRMIMQSTIMKYNYREVEHLVEFAKSNKFDGINIIPIRVVENEDNIFHTNDQKAISFLEKVLPAILKKYDDPGFRVFNQLPVRLCNQESLSVIEEPQGEMVCSANNAVPDFLHTESSLLCYWPWKSMYVLYAGTVRPYGFCEHDIGNINDQSLEDIWNSRPMQEYRKRILSNERGEMCSNRCISGILPKDSLKLD
ncbi:MAG: tetratricopeptide repeat protein [Elusimicrobia bacterium]|nr:tetratricopeptide repeat protein [Elusimicrobiota bacterium]